MRAALLAAGALGALMSGSGPTVFGVARSFEHARQIRRRLTRGSWDCWAVRTLTGPAIRVVAGECEPSRGLRRGERGNGFWRASLAGASGEASGENVFRAWLSGQ